MDSEFPDPDEKFDLLHQDEYEVRKEIEEEVKKKESVQLQKIQIPTSKENNSKICSNNTSANLDKASNFNGDTKKRSYEELFGDISDLANDDFVELNEPEEKKPRWDESGNIIKIVFETKKRLQDDVDIFITEDCQQEKERKENEFVSLRVPSCNFVTFTRLRDSQRLYVKAKTQRDRAVNDSRQISNLFAVPFSQLKAEAEEIIVNSVEKASYNLSKSSSIKDVIDDNLWVDKYRPQTYMELLTDETVNRQFLQWLKLWDKMVFNRNTPPTKKKKIIPLFGQKKPIINNNFEETDSKGFPIQRIALLSGPPGLGKTTLAHLAAKHAGYNVVEINASDERDPEAFRQILLSSTQMKAVIGEDPRPNCLIFDEIDGAPAASIDLLLKFVHGKLMTKDKKKKLERQLDGCQRPIVCICNEPYSPSLRALRAVALTVAVPEVTPSRLADRLMEIAQRENISVSFDDLIKLAERSGCDVRSCLGVLQYTGGTNLENNPTLGLKDTRKGLFDSWKSILKIPMNRGGLVPISTRVNSVLKTIQNAETERLAQGIFHNYPELCNEKLVNISISLEWFQFFDEILSFVMSHQAWGVMSYTNYAFITWHLYLSKIQNPKLSYPLAMQEAAQKLSRSMGILSAVQKFCGRDSSVLSTDIAPFLPDILNTRIRTVSGHLHSSKERFDLIRLVNIMLDFGLTLIQEKTAEGGYEYKLDPDIFSVAVFPECKMRRALAYAVKQIIAQELSAERLRRLTHAIENGQARNHGEKEDSKKENTTAELNTTDKERNKTMKDVPNHLRELKVPEIKPAETVYKDFFGRVITANQNKSHSKETEGLLQMISPKSEKAFSKIREILMRHGVWYKYKEGFSNAVRRTACMETFI